MTVFWLCLLVLLIGTLILEIREFNLKDLELKHITYRDHLKVRKVLNAEKWTRRKQDTITKQQHIDYYFATALTMTYYGIYHKHKFCGYIRLEEVDATCYNISVLVMPAVRGLGVGKAALKLTHTRLKKYSREHIKIQGEVMKSNPSGVKFWRPILSTNGAKLEEVADAMKFSYII